MKYCTSLKTTLLESLILMYVDALHSFTHAMADDSVTCLDGECGPKPRLMPSINCLAQKSLSREVDWVDLDGTFSFSFSFSDCCSSLTVASRLEGLSMSSSICSGQTKVLLFLFSVLKYSTKSSRGSQQLDKYKMNYIDSSKYYQCYLR